MSRTSCVSSLSDQDQSSVYKCIGGSRVGMQITRIGALSDCDRRYWEVAGVFTTADLEAVAIKRRNNEDGTVGMYKAVW